MTGPLDPEPRDFDHARYGLPTPENLARATRAQRRAIERVIASERQQAKQAVADVLLRQAADAADAAIAESRAEARAGLAADPAVALAVAALRPRPETVLPDQAPAPAGWRQRIRNAVRTAWAVLTQPHLVPDRCTCGHSRTACRTRRKDTP